MYSSYPEDTPDTLLTRIQDAHVKWIVCDPCSVGQAKEAAALAEWPIEIIVFVKPGQVEKAEEHSVLASMLLDGTTNVDEIFSDDGSGRQKDIMTNTSILLLCHSQFIYLWIVFIHFFQHVPRMCWKKVTWMIHF